MPKTQKTKPALPIISFSGPDPSSSRLYRYSVDVSHCIVGHKIVLHDVNLVPIDAGGDDWNSEVLGPDVHAAGAEDPG